jgi:hypothetical protein
MSESSRWVLQAAATSRETFPDSHCEFLPHEVWSAPSNVGRRFGNRIALRRDLLSPDLGDAPYVALPELCRGSTTPGAARGTEGYNTWSAVLVPLVRYLDDVAGASASNASAGTATTRPNDRPVGAADLPAYRREAELLAAAQPALATPDFVGVVPMGPSPVAWTIERPLMRPLRDVVDPLAWAYVCRIAGDVAPDESIAVPPGPGLHSTVFLPEGFVLSPRLFATMQIAYYVGLNFVAELCSAFLAEILRPMTEQEVLAVCGLKQAPDASVAAAAALPSFVADETAEVAQMFPWIVGSTAQPRATATVGGVRSATMEAKLAVSHPLP